MYKIIPFEAKYRDDAIFCVLSSKNALGRIPKLNEDMLYIEKNYFDTGNMFWIAIDHSDRIIGTLGTQIVSETDMWLKRLFIKPSFKRKGIGSALLKEAEKFAELKGIAIIHTRFADDFNEAAYFYFNKNFIESERSGEYRHFIKKIK